MEWEIIHQITSEIYFFREFIGNTHLAGFRNIKKGRKPPMVSSHIASFLSQVYKLSVYIIKSKKKVHQCGLRCLICGVPKHLYAECILDGVLVLPLRINKLEKLASWIIKTSCLYRLFTYLSSILCQKYQNLYTWHTEKLLCGLSHLTQTNMDLSKDLIYTYIVFASCQGLIVLWFFVFWFLFLFS